MENRGLSDEVDLLWWHQELELCAEQTPLRCSQPYLTLVIGNDVATMIRRSAGHADRRALSSKRSVMRLTAEDIETLRNTLPICYRLRSEASMRA